MNTLASERKSTPFLVEPKALIIKRRNFSSVNPLKRKLPQRKFLIVSKPKKQKEKTLKNVNRSQSFEKQLYISYNERPKETLEKRIRDFREYTNALGIELGLEFDNFEQIKKENKKIISYDRVHRKSTIKPAYERILDYKMKNWNFTEKKKINNYGQRAAIQHCMTKKLKKELDLATLISSDKSQKMNNFMSKNDKEKNVKKTKKKIIIQQQNKENIQHAKRIKGIQVDGFDIYKPTKMLKKKEWNKGNYKKEIKGVVLKVDSEQRKMVIGKDALFQKVFLEEKKEEIREMEKGLRETMKKEGLTLEDVGEQLTMAERNNREIFKDLQKFTIEPIRKVEQKDPKLIEKTEIIENIKQKLNNPFSPTNQIEIPLTNKSSQRPKTEKKNCVKTRAQSRATNSRPTTAFSKSLNQKMKIFRLFSGKTKAQISRFELDSMRSEGQSKAIRKLKRDIPSFDKESVEEIEITEKKESNNNQIVISQKKQIPIQKIQNKSFQNLQEKKIQMNKEIQAQKEFIENKQKIHSHESNIITINKFPEFNEKKNNRKRIQTSKPNISKSKTRNMKSATLERPVIESKFNNDKNVEYGEEWDDIPDELLIPEDDEFSSEEISESLSKREFTDEEKVRNIGENVYGTRHQEELINQKQKIKYGRINEKDGNQIQRYKNKEKNYQELKEINKKSPNFNPNKYNDKNGKEQVKLMTYLDSVFNITNNIDYSNQNQIHSFQNPKSRECHDHEHNENSLKKTGKSLNCSLMNLKAKILKEKNVEIEHLRRFDEHYLANFNLNKINKALWNKFLSIQMEKEISSKNSSFKNLRYNYKLKKKIAKESPVLMEFICLEMEERGRINENYGQKLLKTKDIREEIELKKITEDVKEQIKDAQSCLSGNYEMGQEEITIVSEGDINRLLSNSVKSPYNYDGYNNENDNDCSHEYASDYTNIINNTEQSSYNKDTISEEMTINESSESSQKMNYKNKFSHNKDNEGNHIVRINYLQKNETFQHSKFKNAKPLLINKKIKNQKESKNKRKKMRIQSAFPIKKSKNASEFNSVSQKFLSTLPEHELNIQVIPLRDFSKKNFQASEIRVRRERHPISVSNVHLRIDKKNKKRLPSIRSANYKGGCYGQKVFEKMNTLEELANAEKKQIDYVGFYNKSPQPFKQFNKVIKAPSNQRPLTSIINNSNNDNFKRNRNRKLQRPHTSIIRKGQNQDLENEISKKIKTSNFKPNKKSGISQYPNKPERKAKSMYKIHTRGCYHRVPTSKTSPFLFPSHQKKFNSPNIFPLKSSLFSSIKDLRIQSRAQFLSVTASFKWRNLFSFAQEYERKKNFAKAEKYYRKLLNKAKKVNNFEANNFITNRLAFCLYRQESMVECFALNCLNFYNLRLKDRLVCLYNAILISRQMANARMEFYFLETTKKVAELMGERHVIFLVGLQMIVFLIVYNCFESGKMYLKNLLKTSSKVTKKYAKETQYLSFLIQCNLNEPLKKELIVFSNVKKVFANKRMEKASTRETIMKVKD